jgi:hypothetical protein
MHSSVNLKKLWQFIETKRKKNARILARILLMLYEVIGGL